MSFRAFRFKKLYWPFADNMASKIKKSFEAMYKKKPNLDSIKVFDCSASVQVEKKFSRQD